MQWGKIRRKQQVTTSKGQDRRVLKSKTQLCEGKLVAKLDCERAELCFFSWRFNLIFLFSPPPVRKHCVDAGKCYLSASEFRFLNSRP